MSWHMLSSRITALSVVPSRAQDLASWDRFFGQLRRLSASDLALVLEETRESHLAWFDDLTVAGETKSEAMANLAKENRLRGYWSRIVLEFKQATRVCLVCTQHA